MIKQEEKSAKFHIRLRMLRKEKGYTQAKLAEMLNYGCTAITNYESGRNEPSISDLIKCAKIFDVTVDYLIGNDNRRKPFELSELSELSLYLDRFIRLYSNSQAEERKYLNFILLGVIKLLKKQRKNST